MYDSGVDQGSYAWLGVDGVPSSPLMQMLGGEAIVPGSPPSYELCKTIHAYHPLGAILTDAPITRAQAKKRELNVPVLGEKRVIEQFEATWETIAKVSATVVLHNLLKTSRIYGIATLAVGERGKKTSEPLDLAKVDDADLYFNVFDALNTAGALVLNQDPHSIDFMKPIGPVSVAGQVWHPSRLFIKMNEQPLYIEWTSSAFGFVGRSVYQRALFPLKTFLQSMITDQFVTIKAGLLVHNAKSPSTAIDNAMLKIFGFKRSQIKAGVTSQVLQIGLEEKLETLNMQNLEAPAKFARDNCLKNIASAAGMPSTIINQETLVSGLADGTEDAKKEAAYLDYIREDMQPAYDFMDRIVMRKAWTPEFYESLKPDYEEYRKMPYETAIHEWMRAFEATWPNLLVEPDSEKSKTADVQFKAVVAMLETVGPLLDPENRAALITWAAENANEREELFASKLIIDQDALSDHLETQAAAAISAASEGDEKEPGKPRPFSAAS